MERTEIEQGGLVKRLACLLSPLPQMFSTAEQDSNVHKGIHARRPPERAAHNWPTGESHFLLSPSCCISLTRAVRLTRSLVIVCTLPNPRSSCGPGALGSLPLSRSHRHSEQDAYSARLYALALFTSHFICLMAAARLAMDARFDYLADHADDAAACSRPSELRRR